MDYSSVPLVVESAELERAAMDYLNDAKAVACWLDEQPGFMQDVFEKTINKHLAFIKETKAKIEKATESLRKIDEHFRRLEH